MQFTTLYKLFQCKQKTKIQCIVFIIESKVKKSYNNVFLSYFSDTLFSCRMTFTIEADIGGFLIMEHRENHVNETHNLIGTTKTLEYVFRWDFVFPYHCVEKETNTENCVDPLTVHDLTEQVRFYF